MMVASCIPFPFFALCDDMLTILVCVTRWLSMHLYTLAYMSLHESCLIVCLPCFNTMKLWTSDPNLHLSLTDSTLGCLLSCFVSLFARILVSMFAMSFMFVALCHFVVLFASFLSMAYLLVFFVFAFACMHMKQGCMELGHGLPGASKRCEDVSMQI